NEYVMEAVHEVEHEADPLESRVIVRRAESRRLSDAELEEIWLRTHPGEDLSALWEARARAAEPLPHRPTVVVPALEAWEAVARPEDVIEALVLLREQPPLDLPRARGLVDIDPVLALEVQYERTLAIEQR